MYFLYKVLLSWPTQDAKADDGCSCGPATPGCVFVPPTVQGDPAALRQLFANFDYRALIPLVHVGLATVFTGSCYFLPGLGGSCSSAHQPNGKLQSSIPNSYSVSDRKALQNVLMSANLAGLGWRVSNMMELKSQSQQKLGQTGVLAPRVICDGSNPPVDS